MVKKSNMIVKIFSIILVLCMLISISSNVFAAVGVDPNTWTGTSDKVNTAPISDWSNAVINVVATIGSAAAIIILIVLGIKYMMGSAEEKAEYKKTLLPYIIGAVFVFAASALTGLIYNFMQNAQ